MISPNRRPSITLLSSRGVVFLFVWLLPACCLSSVGFAQPAAENDLYRMTLKDDHSVQLEVKLEGELSGQAVVFQPEFRIGFKFSDPAFALKGMSFPFSYPVPTWLARPGARQIDGGRRDSKQVGDGFEEEIHGASLRGRTVNLFEAAKTVDFELLDASVHEGVIQWTFAPNEGGSLSATIRLPRGQREPLCQIEFQPARNGWFTVIFAGAPTTPESELQEIWQPLAWAEKNLPFPGQVTLAFRCPIPTTLVQSNDLTIGVIADPSELPFDPLPTRYNSRFAVGLRDADGGIHPWLSAPAFGIGESKMKGNENYKFSFLLYARPLKIPQSFEDIGRRQFGFRDFRHNALGSINATLHNVIDYGLSEYSMWNAELKGCGYSTDVPGAVKNVSSLHPLNLAILTDDETMFKTRARPIIEYLLSREKFLFVLDPKVTAQKPSRKLLGPSAPLSELVALHHISGMTTSPFLKLAEQVYGKDRILNLDTVTPGDRWQDHLAMYRLKGDESLLLKALEGAEQHIQETLSGNRTGGIDGFFWNQFIADYIHLFEVYQATGQQEYLIAAHQGARRFAMFCWLCPLVPADEQVRVNQGGFAPHYDYLIHHPREPAAEESVPAWRLSETGLTPESSGTSAGHRAIFMAHHAPWFLRIAEITGDPFLAELARHAVIGRSKNFPGYHINTARTSAYEKIDFPLKPHEAHSVNSFHYNHIMPFAVNLIDYLLADASFKSKGKILFPAEFIEAYAYLQNRFMGHRRGTFYSHEDVQLWLPRDLFSEINPELNWIACYDDENLYLALMNQSQSSQQANLKFNPQRIRTTGEGSVWRLGVAEPPVPVAKVAELQVDPGSIAAIKFQGLQPAIRFTRKLQDSETWKTDYTEIPVGNGRVMRLAFGREQAWVYAYFQGDEQVIQSVTLRYRDDSSGWKTEVDDKYPFEFSVDLAPDATRWEAEFIVQQPGGQQQQAPVTLSK